MTTQSATARAAFGSIMGTVASTANSISALVNTTGRSIGMLDAFVTKASDEQTMKHKAAKLTFTKDLIRSSAEAEATANIRVLEFCNQSPAHAEQYATAYNEFSALLQPE